jgi:hypothetical protein
MRSSLLLMKSFGMCGSVFDLFLYPADMDVHPSISIHYSEFGPSRPSFQCSACTISHKNMGVHVKDTMADLNGRRRERDPASGRDAPPAKRARRSSNSPAPTLRQRLASPTPSLSSDRYREHADTERNLSPTNNLPGTPPQDMHGETNHQPCPRRSPSPNATPSYSAQGLPSPKISSTAERPPDVTQRDEGGVSSKRFH